MLKVNRTHMHRIMADNLTSIQRRRNMQAIRSKNTTPELLVRKFLHAEGFRFRLHDRSLPGCPDIVLKRHGVLIFVHGCFWHQHGCGRSVLPKTRASYWHPKLQNNVRRHANRLKTLRGLGWRVITVWECQIDTTALRRRLATLLRKKGTRLRPSKLSNV